MASSLADVLCLRATSVADPSARVQLFRSILAGLSPIELEDVTRSLVERAGMRDTRAQVALLALEIARHTLAAVSESVHQVPARAKASVDVPEGADDAEPEPVRVPDYGRGRVLTLGERKTLARKPDRKLIDRVLRDPHPDVIALLLQNPRITEDDVVRLCARRPNVPEVLLQVFAALRWSQRTRVQTSLARNPYTPRDVAEALVPLLDPETLHDMAADEHLAPRVRRRALEVLSRLPPTPPDPSGAIH